MIKISLFCKEVSNFVKQYCALGDLSTSHHSMFFFEIEEIIELVL